MERKKTKDQKGRGRILSKKNKIKRGRRVTITFWKVAEL